MKRGFTLAEIMVTLAIVTVGMSGMLSAFSKALNVTRNIEENEIALAIAESTLEKYRGEGYLQLQDFSADSAFIIPGLSGYTVTLKTNRPQDPALVSVTVSWLVNGGTDSLSLTTLISNYK